MKQAQYVIVRHDNNLQAQWNAKIILFDTQEEAEDLLSHPCLFREPMNVEIKKGVYFIENSINYKDLKNKEDFIAELEYIKDLDSEVIRIAKKVL